MPVNTHNEDEIKLGVVFRALWDGKITIIAMTALFVALALVKGQLTEPKYKSVSRFIIKSSSSSINPQIASIATLIGGGKSLNMEEDPSTFFPYIINDDAFLEKILAHKFALGGDSVALSELWKMRPDTTLPDWQYRFEKRKISALRDSKTFRLSKVPDNMMLLETFLPDPKLTYEFNLYMINLLDDYVVNKLKLKAKENRKFIEERVADITQELKVSEDQLVQFRQNNFDVRAPKVLMEMARLDQKVTINREIYLQLRKELELAKIDEYKDQPLIDLINAPIVPIDRDSPRRKELAIVGFLAGLVAGSVLVLLRRFLFGGLKRDRSLPSAD
jgi:uncharacterized protein involved in exopolysaccharide biosynthesis